MSLRDAAGRCEIRQADSVAYLQLPRVGLQRTLYAMPALVIAAALMSTLLRAEKTHGDVIDREQEAQSA